MRGQDSRQGCMVVLMNPEDRVPKDHPLRRVRVLVDEALTDLSPVFDEMYSHTGRPSIPPERLLASTLLMALYSIRSERMFCEQLEYNLLFRWFLRMDMEEPAFDHSVFSANRARLLEHDVAGEFFRRVVLLARKQKLTSDEHFTADGTLIEAWASMKSFRPKGERPGDRPPADDPGNPTVDFHGEKRSNATHQSTTDPEARLMRKAKGKEAKLCFSLHTLMENRNGLVVDFRVDEANGTAEREVAVDMMDQSLPGSRRLTLAADKAYDTAEFVADCRDRNVTPHVAQNLGRGGGSAIDQRTTRHKGYGLSQWKRKRVEEIFGWVKTVACFHRTRYKGKARTQLWAYLVGAAYNLLRIARLQAAPA
jgi:transposase